MKLRLHYFILIIILSVYAFLAYSLLLVTPTINNDEAIMADISFNLLTENRIGTNLWSGIVDGVENHAYWLPPLFFYLNAAWFEIVGFSIHNLRLVNIFLGSIFLILFFFISSSYLAGKTIKTKVLALSACLLIATDSIFLRSSRVGRPEMLCLLLAVAGYFFFLKNFKGSDLKINPKDLILAALFLGLAFITHFIALAFILPVLLTILISLKFRTFRSPAFYMFLAVVTTPALIYMISIFPHLNHLFEQLNLISLSRSISISWFTTVSAYSPLPLKILYSLYLLISFIYIFSLRNFRDTRYLLLSITLISAWLFTTLGKIYWYTFYPLPFIYIAFISLFVEYSVQKNSLKKIIWTGTAFLLIFLNIYLFQTQKNTNNNSPKYYNYGEQIRQLIPAGSTIYLSSFPDLYFIFKESNLKSQSQYILYEWPVLQTSKENYIKLLNKSEYVVTDGNYSYSVHSNVFKEYLEQNQLSVSTINNIQVIKLKDRQDRIYVD